MGANPLARLSGQVWQRFGLNLWVSSFSKKQRLEQRGSFRAWGAFPESRSPPLSIFRVTLIKFRDCYTCASLAPGHDGLLPLRQRGSSEVSHSKSSSNGEWSRRGYQRRLDSHQAVNPRLPLLLLSHQIARDHVLSVFSGYICPPA